MTTSPGAIPDFSAPGDRPPQVAIGVSGGIACYKAAEIVRRLQDHGIQVVVMMTRGATRFVTPLTFGALSGRHVYTEIFEGSRPGDDFDRAFDHIFVAGSTDVFLVAPATANCIARLANGIADDFLTTFHLAATCPLVVAPAMNTRMWEHPAVQANLSTLSNRGATIIDPEVGEMACKTYGPGRLADVERIVETVVRMLSRRQDLRGRKVLVTAGPTVEDIDPVRFISNRSSGKMGFALARAVRERGGEVVLISGPTTLDDAGAIRVRTTEEMHAAVFDNLDGVDAVIKAAAPLDFRPVTSSEQKIKKRDGLHVEFEPTIDILADLGRRKNGVRLVGFAAETRDHEASGLEKLRSKNLDLIVVNPASGPDSAFDSDTNRASIIDRDGSIESVGPVSKIELAHRILDRLILLW